MEPINAPSPTSTKDALDRISENKQLMSQLESAVDNPAATKKLNLLKSENAILQAVAALGMEEAQKPVTPGMPKTPSTPVTPGFLSKLNPIINAAQLMMQTTDLNTGEQKQLDNLPSNRFSNDILKQVQGNK